MSDFTAAKLHHRFYAIPFLQEAHGVIFLKFVVVIVSVWAEFQLLDLDHMLFLFRIVLLFLLLVLPLPVIHSLGYGRFGCGRDQNEIQTHVLRLADCRRRRHYLNSSIGEDSPNFTGPNRVIHVFPDSWPGSAKTSRRDHLNA